MEGSWSVIADEQCADQRVSQAGKGSEMREDAPGCFTTLILLIAYIGIAYAWAMMIIRGVKWFVS